MSPFLLSSKVKITILPLLMLLLPLLFIAEAAAGNKLLNVEK
jgi:hypothetical protein